MSKKQLNVIKTSPQVKELLKASYELFDLGRRLESQAHQINKQEHPELMQKKWMFTRDLDIHVVGETEQGTMRYLTPEEEEKK